MDPKITLGPVELTSVGIRLLKKGNWEDWQGPVQFAFWCQRAGPWWIGDLLNHGEAHFGESFSQVCQANLSTETLSRYASVARRVPLENRREDLSWSAHAAVARLTPELQRKLLSEAVERGWTSEELRKHARAEVSKRAS